MVVVMLAGAAVVGGLDREQWFLMGWFGPVCATIAILLFATRYLRNQRERMDQAASAGELRKALVSLRQRKGAGVISVPAELLERTAIMRSAQISEERKDAVLQGAAFRKNAYTVALSREAARERAALGVEDRIELEILWRNSAQVASRSNRGHSRSPAAKA